LRASLAILPIPTASTARIQTELDQHPRGRSFWVIVLIAAVAAFVLDVVLQLAIDALAADLVDSELERHLIGAALSVVVVLALGIPLLQRYMRAAKLAGLEASERRHREDDANFLRKQVKERERLQAQLEESRRSMRTLLDNLPGFAYRCLNDSAWTMTFCSEGSFATCGALAEDLMSGKVTFGDHIIHEEDRAMVWDTVQTSLKAKKPFEIRYRIRRPDNGEIRDCWERGTGIWDGEGRLVALEGFIDDVTEQTKAERAAADRLAVLRSLFEAPDVNIGVIRLTADDAILELCNRAGAKYFGKLPHEIEGLSIREIDQTKAEANDATIQHFRELTESGATDMVEYPHRDPDGTNHWFKSTVAPIPSADGSAPFRIGLLAINITARKLAEESIAAKEAILRGLFESKDVNMAILRLDPDAIRIEMVNDHGATFYGRSAADCAGKTFAEVGFSNEATKKAEIKYREVFESGKSFTTEYSNIDSNGRERYYQGTINPIANPSDSGPQRLALVAVEITARFEAERALKSREAMLRGLFESPDINMAIVRLDPDACRMELCNRRGAEFFGLPVDEVEGKSLRELGYPERSVIQTEANFRRVAETGTSDCKEYQSTDKHGRSFWYQATISRVNAPSETEPGRIAIVTIDITQRVEAELARKRSEELYKSVIEEQSDLVARILPRGQIEVCNASFARVVGIPPDRLAGTRLWKIVRVGLSKSDRGKLASAIASLTPASPTALVEVKAKDSLGQVLYLDWRLVGQFKDDGSLRSIQGVGRDITAIKRAQLALEESESKFLQLAESLDHIIWIESIETRRVEFVNDAFEKVFGFSKQALYDDLLLWHNAIPEPNRDQVSEHIKTSVNHPEWEPFQLEYPIRRSDGTIRWLVDRTFPVRDEDGKLIRIAGIAEDVTEKRKSRQEFETATNLLDGILRSSTQGVMAFKAVRAPNGSIVDLEWLLTNPEGERLVAKSHSLLKGRRLLEEMPGNLSDGLFDAYVKVIETGETFTTRHHYDHEALRAWFDITAVKLGDGLAVSFSDVTAQVKAEERSVALGRMIDQSPNEVYIVDAKTLKFLGSNKSAHRNTGFKASQLREMTVMDLAPGSTAEALAPMMSDLTSGLKQSITTFGTHLRADGTTYPTEVTIQYGEYGGQNVFFAVVVDLTERVKAERELRVAKERLELAVKGAGLGIWDWDIGSHETKFDDRYAEMLGYTHDELVAVRSRWADICHPDDYAEARQRLDDHIDGKSEYYSCEVRLRTKSGEYKWILDRGQIVERDEAGNPVRAAGTHLDIDAQKRIQLYQSEIGQLRERQRQIVENSELMEFHLDRRRRILWISSVVERILGREARAIVGSEFGGLEHPDEKGLAFGAFERALAGEGVQRFESRVMDAEGNWKWVSVALSKFEATEPNGPVVGGIAWDISARKDAENSLKLSEERLELAVKGAGLGTWDWNIRLGEKYYSPRWLSMLGYEKEAKVQPPEFFDNLIHPDDCDLAQSSWNHHLIGETPYYESEIRLRTVDGTYKWILDRGQVVERDEEGRPLRAAGTHFDIDAQKRVQVYQQELAAVQQRLRQIVENTDQVEFYQDLEGHFTFVSPVAERVLGFNPEALLGKGCEDSVHPDDLAGVLGIKAEMLKSGIGMRGIEYRVRHGDGNYYWHTSSLSLTRAPNGTVTGFGGLTADISARKTAEAASEALKTQLLQAQKMEAVGRLVGGVAHDFNNLLTPMLGHAELLIRKVLPGTPSHQHAEVIRDAASRAGDVTRQLLAFSRKQVMTMRVVPLNDVVKEFSGMIRRLIGEDIRIEMHLDPKTGNVKADASQLQQVIMNLAVNARDAMPEGGTLTFQTRNLPSRPDKGLHGPVAELSVADSGCGIDPEIIGSIFDPFFTTKERDKGTGLGLSTAYGIVQQHGGVIEVQSQMGLGSIFRVLLPLAEGSNNPVIEALTSPTAQTKGRGTVLVVEDDEMVRMLVQDALLDAGHTVFTATGPAKAIESLRKLPHVDVLLTDVVMPGMKGPDLYREVAALRPDIRVVYMSGYTDDVLGRMGISVNGETSVRFVQKPFTIEHLVAAVRKAVEEV